MEKIIRGGLPFTVIIPTHNRPRLLERALSSIKIQKESEDCEIIVISDQSNSETSAVCDRILGSKDSYIRRGGPNGPSASRNLGLKIAKGNIILFLDDDDAWHPDLLKHLKYSQKLHSGNPIYFDCSVVKEQRLPTHSVFLEEKKLSYAGHLTSAVFVKNLVHMSCFAFPSYLLKDLYFDSSLRAYEDWDFLLGVFRRNFPLHESFLGSRIFEVDDNTTDRRGSSADANNFHAVLDYLSIYRKHPAPTEEIKSQRSALLSTVGLTIPMDML